MNSLETTPMRFTDWVSMGGACLKAKNEPGMQLAIDSMHYDVAGVLLFLLFMEEISEDDAIDIMAACILKAAHDMLRWRGHVALC